LPDVLDAIVDHAQNFGYHPRSSAQSDMQSRYIVADLLNRCPKLQDRALQGNVVVRFTHHQQVGYEDWKIDIAIGTPAYPTPPHAALISEETPVLIQIAIELKSVWTEHNKAKRNRLRDFAAFHGHAHRYDNRVVAGAFLAVNASDAFFSPLNAGRPQPITVHGLGTGSGLAAAKGTIDLFRSIHLRNSAIDPPGLEALGVVVVKHDNFNALPPSLAHLAQHESSIGIRNQPAPRIGDPLHYETFLQRICTQYSSRY